MIVTQHARRIRAPVGIGHLDVVSLDDQVTDGEDQAIAADHRAGALALAPQRSTAARARNGNRLDAHQRGVEPFGIDAGFRGRLR